MPSPACTQQVAPACAQTLMCPDTDLEHSLSQESPDKDQMASKGNREAPGATWWSGQRRRCLGVLWPEQPDLEEPQQPDSFLLPVEEEGCHLGISVATLDLMTISMLMFLPQCLLTSGLQLPLSHPP